MLDDITLYWLTNTAASSGRLYWENRGASPTSATAMKTAQISVPVGVTVFPDDVYRPPQTWARRAYPTLTYFHEVGKGGHFAAWSSPSCSPPRSGPRSGHSASRARPTRYPGTSTTQAIVRPRPDDGPHDKESPS